MCHKLAACAYLDTQTEKPFKGFPPEFYKGGLQLPLEPLGVSLMC